MGWTYMQSLEGRKTPRAYLDAAFTWSNDQGQCSVIKSSATGSVYYAAVEFLPTAGERVVFAVVCLYRYKRRAGDGYIFGYKDMDETVGPCERDCPVGILDLLTPTTRDYAVGWRADCRANAEKRKARRAKPVPKEGQVVVLAEAMRFTDGQVLDRFRAVRTYDRRALVYRSLANGGLYRITRLADRDYRIEA